MTNIGTWLGLSIIDFYVKVITIWISWLGCTKMYASQYRVLINIAGQTCVHVCVRIGTCQRHAGGQEKGLRVLVWGVLTLSCWDRCWASPDMQLLQTLEYQLLRVSQMHSLMVMHVNWCPKQHLHIFQLCNIFYALYQQSWLVSHRFKPHVLDQTLNPTFQRYKVWEGAK